jgi:glycosyltransferase involved in cell wall biosynthesis
MTYKEAKIKLLIEQIVMSPFVMAGKLYGNLFPLKTKHNVFLFFSTADIGGGPKVNAQIAECIKEQRPLIIFSKKPNNNEFLHLFNIKGVRIIDLHKFIDNKAFHFLNFFFRGVWAARINKQQKAVVFGGETIFFYKIIPHLRKDINCIELCHLATWLPYSIGFIDRINLRIFSTEYLKQEVEKQYEENNLGSDYFHKLLFVENAIDLPEHKHIENKKLEVVFIGRGSTQKRIHLCAAIAEKMKLANDPVHFSFVGDVEKVIDISKYPYCKFYGNIKDEELIKTIYQQSDVLLLTSAFEGLPVVVMQMMAYGKVVVATAVNGIPDYIRHRQNGLLITATAEEEIIEEGVKLLRQLINNSALKISIGQQNRKAAQEKFSYEPFCSKYRSLLNESKMKSLRGQVHK